MGLTVYQVSDSPTAPLIIIDPLREGKDSLPYDFFRFVSGANKQPQQPQQPRQELV